MNETIRHRGPDDEGFWFGDLQESKSFFGNDTSFELKNKDEIISNEILGNIGLGFRRLSIVDLSAKGHQPMTSKNKQIIITFNGEIYNFKTLKQELIALGHLFETSSDTEVIINAYQEWGEEMIPKLDGMFSFVIFDKNKNTLLIARDRIGMKPFFYYLSKDKIFWASEIKSILASGLVIPEINWDGVYTNFLFQTTLSPKTCFKGIFSLKPGTYMKIDLNNFEIEHQKFWELPSSITKIDKDDAAKQIDFLLKSSIKDQLYADVPVISMMSGGIDSTLITAKAKKIAQNISAFTVDYLFSNEEIKNAQTFAQELGINHSIDKVPDYEIIKNLKENIQHFEEPYSSLEVLLNAAKYAHSLGYKVVLSGNGADELFAGYSHTLKLEQWRKIKKYNGLENFIPIFHPFLQKIKNYLSQKNSLDFFRQSQAGMRPFEIKKLFQNHILENHNFNLNEYILTKEEDYNAFFKYDMRYSLSSHHVYRDDLSAMKYSIEFRYPYLSNALIDYVAQLPPEIRYNGFQNKPLLRQVAKDYVNQDILNMPKKGFSFPLAHFIKSEKTVENFVIKNLESLKKRNFFKAKTIDIWWNNKKEDFDYVKIWQLVTFELWYQKYFEEKI